jgi:hypothetical protein
MGMTAHSRWSLCNICAIKYIYIANVTTAPQNSLLHSRSLASESSMFATAGRDDKFNEEGYLQ